MSSSPSWLFYSTLRSICILHNIEVQNVSRRTLFNWRNGASIQPDFIDILAYRLFTKGILSYDSLVDIARSCGFSEPLSAFDILAHYSLTSERDGD